jgi:hypothetical protein
MTSRDLERLELERAVDLIGRSTRPGRLLEFLGSKYFSQQEAQLTEFDISTRRTRASTVYRSHCPPGRTFQSSPRTSNPLPPPAAHPRGAGLRSEPSD